MFIGTNGPSADGIYHTYFDQGSGKFSKSERIAEVQSPNFLAIHPDGKNHTVCRWQDGAGVIGYKIFHPFKLVEFTAWIVLMGWGVILLFIRVVNFYSPQYSGGSVAFFPLDTGGILGRPTITEHNGSSGVIKRRQ